MSESSPGWRNLVRDPGLIAALAALLILKFGLLAIYGPGYQPDSGGYVVFAQRMLAGTSWATEVPLAQEPMPITAFRAIGYPAVIALTMAVMPKNWPWLVIVLQIALSTTALVFCFALVRALGAGRFLAALAVFAAGTSMILPIDLVLLTDSMTASCWIIALALLSLGGITGRSLRWTEALGIGLVLTAATLLREGTALLSMLFVLPLAARLVLAPAAARWRSAAAAILVFAPVIVTSQVYQAWNESRTGTRFVTTSGQTTYLVALVKAARHDPTIFAGSDPLDRAARDIVVDHSFAEVLQIVVRLHNEGMTAPEMAASMQRRYFQAWRDHPAAMARLALRHLQENRLIPTVRVSSSVRDAIYWNIGELPWPPYPDLKRSALHDHRPGAIVLFGLEFMEVLGSQIVNLTFLIAPPLWLLTRWRSTGKPYRIAVTAISLWLVCISFLALHLAIHFEHRYMAPVLPFALAIAAAGFQNVIDGSRAIWRQHFGAARQPTSDRPKTEATQRSR
jgi:hypothetical protein